MRGTLFAGFGCLALVAVALGLSCASTPTAENVEVPTTGEAFEGPDAVNCSAIRPPTEPDLMACDSGSRGNLHNLQAQTQPFALELRLHACGCKR
jgi:hypothetical protein